jgi:hypothetical protein
VNLLIEMEKRLEKGRKIDDLLPAGAKWAGQTETAATSYIREEEEDLNGVDGCWGCN